ncbi:hypothetical protein [Nakamurella multipartita]|uniref:Uncharacterized protein n=1 Tax=Nakamurella multipartita (strain ATCC 700099 / DSM 44233 / CIP 104796 / JCM 9543 / NBRC 105858 / Y-104) TaxID=479431 RepID=C8X8P1_NAKMY|nr:hypothetical protein [Nakamurella multipartita]ACV79096.1 hypothetical protein Namu_2750 [Nakamurella multipartita DSM 44233]
MTATVEPLRRRFLTDPGEPLVGGTDPLQSALRYGQAQGYWGIPDSHLIQPPVAGCPLPVYPAQGFTRRRWEGLNPAAMWHPLLWLPPRLQGRYMITGEHGEVMEDDDLYAVRVLAEMTVAGLYDEHTGWLDVLALVGLDVDDAADVARVSAWLAGGPDDLLDGIDLSEFLLEAEVAYGNQDWAINYALTGLAAIRAICWADASSCLLADCDSIVDCDSDRSAYLSASTVAQLGRLYFRALPPDTEPEMSWWSAVHGRVERAGEDKQALILGPVGEMANRLSEIRDTYWPILRQIAEAQPPVQPTFGPS